MNITYLQLQSHELLQQNWMKSTTAAPFINALIGIFNKTSFWIASAILGEKSLRNRVKMLTKMVKVQFTTEAINAMILTYYQVAQHLLELNNFHVLMAFVSGLNSSAIARLKWTHAKLSRHAKDVCFPSELISVY